jgi:UDP-N-acetylglucosamine 4,6-dehydratase
LGKNVLITGGTGTFGRAFAKSLLENHRPNKVIIFSRDEWKQWEMRESEPIFSHPNIRYFLGDVRDQERLVRAFTEVNFVIHAAALKQVPAAEYNPSEFIKTNVQGAMNVIHAAISAGVEKVISLSSDKAVNPINLYGATKLCSDKLFIAAKSYVGKRGFPIFSIVRYGNVLGSRGSLLPYWAKMLSEGKPLPVTDPHMTRFWITIAEAVDFVKNAFSCMQGSEIFIPKSPSLKIVDLAKAFAPKVKQTILGIRPGEKIDEFLISEDDSCHAFETQEYYLVVPPQEISKWQKLKKVPKGFSLSSKNNPLFIRSIDQIKKLLTALPKELRIS